MDFRQKIDISSPTVKEEYRSEGGEVKNILKKNIFFETVGVFACLFK